MAKGSFVGCLVLQRIVLPLVLAFSIFFRPVALTLPNLFLLLWLPLVPIATPKTIRGHTGIYLKIVIAISVLTVITQIAFQITLAALGESLVPPCSFLEILLRHIGLIRLTSLAFLDIFIWYLPDVVMPIFSIACFIFIKKMAIGVQGDAEGQPPIEQNWDANEHEGYTAERLRFLKRLCAFVCLAALLLAAILRPSIPGGLYFIVFLGAATWWGCHKELDRAFAYICRFIMVILAVHIIAVLTYQTPWPQEYFPANYTITRYLGFSQLVQSTCDDDKTIRVLVYNTELDFDAFLNPVTMLLSFYLMAIATGFILRAKAKKDRPESDEPNEKTPLMRRSMKGLKNLKKRGPSALLGHNEGIPLEELEEEVESVGGESDADDGPGFMASIWYGLQQFGAFIYRNSYVFTNITMMAWSIVFHSWLTFLYLIWANLIWVLPNQRQSMLRSSPFIVLYAEFLLIAQYIYGMNLTEDELPSKTTGGVNIHQIGFIRYERWPSGPIFLKTMFTILFWASLRQLIQEEKAKKQSTTLANMVAPLQVTVGAAAAELAPQTVEKKPALMIKIGEFVNKVLVRFWVWILIIALFTSAVTGNRMTAFRIIYMALFLIFMVTFQISWRIWKRMMYPFWIVVIGYAMSILILVYTYQFDGFNDYWEYIGIPQKLQSDLGLERYHTKQLFLHLVNPTLVVVMTVVQVHYFHQYYMKIFDLPTTAAQAEESSTSSGEPNDEKNLEIEKQKQDAIDLESWSRNDIKKTLKNKMERYLKIVIRELQKIIELVWIFLELHLVKAIMLCAFLLSVADVCVLHTFLVILSIVGVVGKSQIKTPISRVLSVVMAILLIGKMIYQIEYIDHSSYDPDCDPSSNATTNSTVPVVYNTAEWIGFRKIVDKTSLAYLVRGYLFYIILTSFHAFVNFRQKRARFIKGLPMKRPYVLFPDISRNEADIDTLHMIKYLFNYGFYKFGIEFTMIANVALIGFRMDIVAVFYSVWLWILFSISRETKVRYFRYFKWFITGLIPVQYILFVGLPPLLCLEYPWSTPMMKNLQEFMLLPDPTLRFDAKKLILDFVLLYITTRQYLVFKMEIWDKENPDIIYPGGSNDEILEEIEELGHTTFKNPMEDYITKTKNWLDIFKKALFTGLFWLTLSIVFLTGTNRTNLFSIGYLVGSFIFLWQGSDFYLRPIRVINKWWSYLVTYNVVVITLKAILQVPGCIFIHELEKSCCWLIQLMGVRCIRKFGIKDQRELECIVPTDGVGLFWDGICFGFLLLQLRMFQSFYFCHVIDDTKATTILASRGAELIEALRQKEMKSQLDHEEAILGKIKQKMDRIKANQQRVLSPIREPGTHFEEDGVPLEHANSINSFAGYHTPVEEDADGSMLNGAEVVSELPSDQSGIGITPRASLFLQTQAPSPSSAGSAIMTVSLDVDAYLEPQRLSFSSPPGSEIVQEKLPPQNGGSEESYPVFSPPPYEPREEPPPVNNSLMPPTHTAGNRTHRRQSSLNTVSWTDQGETAVGQRSRLQSTADPPDDNILRRRRSSQGRNSSIGGWVPDEVLNQRRRSSNVSWMNDEDISARTGRRHYSWGPIGEIYFRESLLSEADRIPMSHQEWFIEYEGRLYRPKSVPITYKDAIRSGDYYMFEDLDEKVELELINLPPMTMSEDAAIPPEKLANKRTLEEVILTKLKARRQKTSEMSVALTERGERRLSTATPAPRSSVSEQIATSSSSDPRPGSSKDSDDKPPRDDDDEPTYESEPMPEQKRKDKLASAAKFVYAFISGLLLSVAVRLYKLSKNYRYVMKVLWKEKRALKVSKIHSDEDSAQPWTELHHRFRQTSAYVSEPNSMPTISATASVRSQTESRNVANTDEVMLDDSSSASSSRISLELETEIHRRQGSSRHTHKHAPVHSLFQLGEEDERRTSVVPEIRILAPSLERGLDDSSPYRLNTYELTVSKELTEIDSDDFTAKEHPVVIELLFAIWFALLSYTDLLCYCVIFMNMVHSQSVLALPLPIMVFLWGTLTVPRPSKTFWVTIVAYTQVVVIIKCFAQFELFWRNRVASPDNQPLAADKILGLERQTNYASYDLFLLLVIFFHRFVLKSLGLWKSEVVEEKIPQGFYHAETQEQSDDDEDSHPKPSTNGEAKETVVLRQGHLALALTKADLHEVVGDDTKPVLVTNVPEEPSKYFPKIVAVSTKKYCSSITTFFKSLLNRVNRVTADIYAFMFLCDFINFLVLVFGFTAFGSMQGDGGVTSYLEENKVPITFLIMLLLQFVLIIVDRALYLRKFLFGKLVFQFLAVFGMHIWMFFIVPAVSERSFNTKRPPVVYYYIKCLYFLLSAYQIRCGYPTRILGNFLTKGYSIFNLGAFKAYMAMPFLFELRTLMDWIWTDTSMTLMDWLKMEDIFATIFNLKCSRQLEEDLPAARGRAKPALVKYFMGGGFLIAVVLLIWFPLALFALGNTVGKPNIPFDVSVTLRIGPYEPIYIMSAQQSNIHKFKEGEWAELNRQYKRDKTALTFLSSYESEDIAAIILGSNSSSTWNISPPDRKRLLEDLKTNATLTCRFKYTISRISYSKDNPGEANDEQEFVLEPDNPNRFQLAAMLEGDQVDRMTLPQLLPKFLKVKNNGDLKPIPQLMDAGPDVSDEDASFRNLLVKFHQSKGTDGVEYIWWEVKEDCSDNSKVLQNLPYADCNNNMILYTFNDKLFPSSLSWLTGGGIIGIYTSFVFIASRVIRGIFAEGSAKIMFDDLPYVDRILQLCLDIYLVRESQEFALEEDLFAKLIFLYRSPETMIKWTRPLDENVNSEDEDNDDNPKANRGNDDDDLGSDIIQRRPKKAT